MAAQGDKENYKTATRSVIHLRTSVRWWAQGIQDMSFQIGHKTMPPNLNTSKATMAKQLRVGVIVVRCVTFAMQSIHCCPMLQWILHLQPFLYLVEKWCPNRLSWQKHPWQVTYVILWQPDLTPYNTYRITNSDDQPHFVTLVCVLQCSPPLTAKNACEALISPSCALALSGWPIEARTLWTRRETCSDTA